MLKQIFEFLNYLFLEMGWLKSLVEKLLIDVIQMDEGMMIYDSISFFIYDVIKIFILLTILIFISSYIQTYIDIEITRRLLKKFNGFWGNLLGALLGTITPFCSCSSIPIFIGFTRAGLPIGVTFSFLISSPLVDLASIVLIASIFGWKVAIIYVAIGILLAVLGGSFISALKMEEYVEDFIRGDEQEELDVSRNLKIAERIKISWGQVKDIIIRVWKWILIGVLIGAIIHGYIPAAFIDSVLGNDRWYSVFVAVVAGIPMYADIFGTLPIAEALV
ncbi:MAG: permease, partial [Bacilli bacterium]|nr:permease [Bacilli bacterium]